MVKVQVPYKAFLFLTEKPIVSSYLSPFPAPPLGPFQPRPSRESSGKLTEVFGKLSGNFRKGSESGREFPEVFGKLSGISGKLSRVRSVVHGSSGKVVAHAQCGPRGFPESCRAGSDVIASYPGSLIDVPCRGLVTKAVTIDGFRDSTNIKS